MNLFSQIKFLLFVLLTLSISSCGWIFKDHRYDYLEERQVESIKLPEDEISKPLVDFYPIPSKDQEKTLSNNYEIPLPQQVFSSGSTNEIRMHKLGELRWLYVEALPSSIWPLMKDFWSSSGYGISFEDPNTGIIKSEEIIIERIKI